MVKLYTTHCPSCKALELKLKQAQIDFDVVDDKEEVLRIAKENNLTTAPILVVDDAVMNFSNAIKWVNNR